MLRPVRLLALPCLPCLLALAALSACGDHPAAADPVASLSLGPDAAYLRMGGSLRLIPIARTADNEPVPGVRVTFTSSDAAVATVDSTGLVTALGRGSATITARAGDVSDVIAVQVGSVAGIRIVSGAGVEDTITAPLAAPLVVEVRDLEGRPEAGVQLAFEAIYRGPQFEPSVVFPLSPGESMPWRIVSTDSAGRVSVPVRLGTPAGVGGVSIRRMSMQVGVDTAWYTVRPGAAARVRLAPRDTTVFTGRTLTLRTELSDRGGNPVSGAPQFVAADGPLAVNAQGVVTGGAYGTSRIVARTAIGADTVRVASVPVGAVVVASTQGGVGMINLDGTSRRVPATSGGAPDWHPSGQHVVYITQAGFGTLSAAGVSGATFPVGVNASLQWPQYSRDGAWLYFHSLKQDSALIWRVRASDGGGLERVTPADRRLESHPSPSPDGTRVAYFAGHVYEARIRVRDLRTGQETDLGAGLTPTWSPDGNWIAFIVQERFSDFTGAIAVMRPDGTERRIVSPAGARYSQSPRWSPDGRWIVAASDHVHLLEVETGLVIDLPYWEGIASAAWKPNGLLP